MQEKIYTHVLDNIISNMTDNMTDEGVDTMLTLSTSQNMPMSVTNVLNRHLQAAVDAATQVIQDTKAPIFFLQIDPLQEDDEATDDNNEEEEEEEDDDIDYRPYLDAAEDYDEREDDDDAEARTELISFLQQVEPFASMDSDDIEYVVDDGLVQREIENYEPEPRIKNPIVSISFYQPTYGELGNNENRTLQRLRRTNSRNTPVINSNMLLNAVGNGVDGVDIGQYHLDRTKCEFEGTFNGAFSVDSGGLAAHPGRTLINVQERMTLRQLLEGAIHVVDTSFLQEYAIIPIHLRHDRIAVDIL